MKKMSIFLLVMMHSFVLSAMQYDCNEAQEKIYEMPHYLKEIVELIEKKEQTELIIFCIKRLSKHDLNKLYKFEYYTHWKNQAGSLITEKECKNGYSLLHIVVLYRRSDLIKPLLEHGAKFDIRSSQETGYIIPYDLAFKQDDANCKYELYQCAPVEFDKNVHFSSNL